MSTPAHTRPSVPSALAGRTRDALRPLVIGLATVTLLITSSVMDTGGIAHAATGPKRAVVVAGPVHSKTAEYRAYCAAIAKAAAAQGMEVVRVFHPWAPPSKVKRVAQGADLFVYCGHGNGWPSPYGDFQEDTKNGLGLDVEAKAERDDSTVNYVGADWLRANLQLAPNAVVILSHLSYASGNASSGMAIPSREVAIERVDNYANGFLSIGARVVWALGWQPGADVINALYGEDSSMDAIFMTRYRDGVNPRNGWIGTRPGYYDSGRIPGAVVHIDPHDSYGYLRGLTGDLGFTTTEWRDDQAVAADTVAPVVSGVRAYQARDTISSSRVPVFTPNGDGRSDVIRVGYQLSEGAFLDVKVKRNGSAKRRWSAWAMAGNGSFTWNGRFDGGAIGPEGNYAVYLTPTDRAGNQGATQVVKIKLLNSVANPRVRPEIFWARDGDARAAKVTLNARLTREATVSWVVRDRKGKIVRRAVAAAPRQPGPVKFVWDGTDDSGKYVPDDIYRARITVVRPAGSYAHEVRLRQTPFVASSSRWVYRRGETVVLDITSTEPLEGKPVVTANQPGIRKYTVPRWKVKRLSAKRFKVIIATRGGGPAGGMKVRVKGVDVDGGTNAKVFTVRLR